MNASVRMLAARLRELTKDAEELAGRNNLPLRGIPYDVLRTEFKRIREERGHTLRDVAAQSGLDTAAVYRIEQGKPIMPDKIAALAKWLGEPIIFMP